MVISSKEKQLIKQLLNTYDTVGRLGRPVNDSEDKLVVEYGLTLVQILDLDERNQVLTTNVWGTYVRIHWTTRERNGECAPLEYGELKL